MSLVFCLYRCFEQFRGQAEKAALLFAGVCSSINNRSAVPVLGEVLEGDFDVAMHHAIRRIGRHDREKSGEDKCVRRFA